MSSCDSCIDPGETALGPAWEWAEASIVTSVDSTLSTDISEDSSDGGKCSCFIPVHRGRCSVGGDL